MRPILLSGLAILTMAGLSACSEKTANNVERAGDSIGNDLERGINNADDVAGSALNKAGNAIDRAGDRIENATADAAGKADRAADKARADIGNSLERAGKDLKN